MSDFTPTTEEIREYLETGGEPRPWVELDEAEETRQKARGEAFDRWLAAHDAEVRAESAEAHERTKRGAKALGEIVVRQVEDTLRWAGMEDQIGTDDPDQQLAWERCAEMPGRIAELEAELAELRAGVVAEEPEWEYGWHTGSTVSLIGRREQIDEWLMVRGWKLGEGDWGSRIMQRTAAGPWVPVKQEGAEK